MRKRVLKFFSMMVATLVITAMTAVSTPAKSSKKAPKPTTHSSSAQSDSPATASRPSSVSTSNPGQLDREPGPTWKTIGGTVRQINGNTYMVEDYEGNQVQLYVTRATKKLHRNKKVGDTVRAEMTRSGFENSVQ